MCYLRENLIGLHKQTKAIYNIHRTIAIRSKSVPEILPMRLSYKGRWHKKKILINFISIFKSLIGIVDVKSNFF